MKTQETGKSLEYHHPMKMEKYRDVWATSFVNKLDMLAQGIRDANGSNTIKLIRQSQVPKGRTVTFRRLVCGHQPQKEEKTEQYLLCEGISWTTPVMPELSNC